LSKVSGPFTLAPASITIRGTRLLPLPKWMPKKESPWAFSTLMPPSTKALPAMWMSPFTVVMPWPMWAPSISIRPLTLVSAPFTADPAARLSAPLTVVALPETLASFSRVMSPLTVLAAPACAPLARWIEPLTVVALSALAWASRLTEPFTVLASETLVPAGTSTEPLTPFTQAVMASGNSNSVMTYVQRRVWRMAASCAWQWEVLDGMIVHQHRWFANRPLDMAEKRTEAEVFHDNAHKASCSVPRHARLTDQGREPWSDQ